MESTLPKLLQRVSSEHPEIPIQLWKDNSGKYHPTTYKVFYQEVQTFAAGLKSLGVARQDHVGLISDNRREWFISDMAILALGAADVPRGRDAMPHELSYILSFSECRICCAENLDQAQKILALASEIPLLTKLIILDDEEDLSQLSLPEHMSCIQFNQVLELGKKALSKKPDLIEKEIEKGETEEVATIIFTSGTTGEPKGVMLNHRNFLHQLKQIPKVLTVSPGDVWLSVLPVWHSFERIIQYIIIATASTIAYSKPIGKIMLQDMQKVNPSWMGSVPRIWESVKDGVYQNVKKKSVIARSIFHFFVWAGASYTTCLDMVTGKVPQFKKRSKFLDKVVGIIPLILLSPFRYIGVHSIFKPIKQKLGTRFFAGVSGGGSLPASVDAFFRAIGITLLDGYGLTETAPVIGIRPLQRQIKATVSPLPETEIKIITEEGKPARPGEKGVIYARGPQVMLGYYRKPELTATVLDSDGWLNTGDIGVWTHGGEFAIRGRAKDTIVLSGGENIEPVPIEAKLRESEYIEQAIVVGQDKKYLAALIIPDTKTIELYIKNAGIPYISRSNLLAMPEVIELIDSEIHTLIHSKNGFKSFEHICKFTLLPKSLEIGKELSAKQEIMRHKIYELYSSYIESLYN